LGAVIVAFFFVLSLSSSGSDSGDSLRSGQAKRPTIHSESGSSIPAPTVGKKETKKDGKKDGKKKPSPKSDFDDKQDKGDFDRDDVKEAETTVDMEEDAIVEEAQDKFTRAVQEQLSMNQNMLSTSIGDVMEEARTNLGALLGDSDLVDAEDIELLANQMEDRLNEDLQAVLTEKIDALKQEETVELEIDVDLDNEGVDKDNEPVDLEEEEQKLVVKLRDGVDDICTEARGNLRHMMVGIEKKMLAALLKTKTGDSYHVTFDENDNVIGYKKYSSSSTSTHSSSSKEKSSSGHHSSSSSSSHHSSSKPKSSSSSAHSSSSSTTSQPKSSSSSHHSSSTSTHKSSPAEPKVDSGNDEDDRKM
jgi:hypothetical protein